jgi:hypothetical protein
VRETPLATRTTTGGQGVSERADLLAKEVETKLRVAPESRSARAGVVRTKPKRLTRSTRAGPEGRGPSAKKKEGDCCSKDKSER